MLDIKEIRRPDDAKEFKPEGATVPFYEYKIGDHTIIEFDSSMTGPPEPMVNAMTALKFIDKDRSVVMINHKMPAGLLNKIGENYDIKNMELPNGLVKLLFTYREGASEKADLSDNSCHG
jgi:hypothetical protein